MSYLTEFSSIAVHGCGLVFLSSLLYDPFYKVTFVFWFSEKLMTSDGDFYLDHVNFF